MSTEYKNRLRFYLVLVICIFYAAGANAFTCFPPNPSQLDIIKAPIIFKGAAEKVIKKNGESYIVFKVKHVYRGPKVDSISIRMVEIAAYAPLPPVRIGYERIIMPDKLDNGDLGLSFCSSGARNQKHWMSMVYRANQYKFPTLYLMITLVSPYVYLAILVGLGVLLLLFNVIVNVRRKKRSSSS